MALVGALTFIWLGMVVAISFLEAPLKFRAPGITLQLGLGIGRIVFRALNIAEIVLLVAIAIALIVGSPTAAGLWAAVVAAVVLVAQLLGVRPALTRRSNRVLAGENLPRSGAHYVYVGLEVVKVVVLVVLGVLALTAQG